MTNTTTIRLNGAATTLDKIPSGAEAELRLSTADNSLLSISAKVKATENPGTTEIEGSVVGTTATTVTLKGVNGQPDATFTLAANAVVRLNGAATTADKIPAGAEAELRVSVADKTVLSVSAKFETQGTGGTGDSVTEVEGRVSAVGAGTITLKGRDGQPDATFTVDPSAVVRLNGVTTTLGRIPAGADAELRISNVSKAVIGINAENEQGD